MLTAGRQDGSVALQPVKQKMRVYNPNLLNELLVEAEKAKQHQIQVCSPVWRGCFPQDASSRCLLCCCQQDCLGVHDCLLHAE